MLLLEAGHRNVGFGAELSIDRDALPGTAEGALNLRDILSFQRRMLQPELSAELVHLLRTEAKEFFCFWTNGSVRHKSVVTLKSTDCRGRVFSKDAVDTNGEPLLPQQPL